VLEVATICVQTGLNPARHIFGKALPGTLGISERESLLSISDISIRNNQAASDRASSVAKVPVKDFPKYGVTLFLLERPK
jgi:hypothetical protein